MNTYLPTALLATALFGCASEPLEGGESAEGDGASDAASTLATETLGSSSSASDSIVELYKPALRVLLSATALAFSRATPNELWVTLRQFPSGKTCTEVDPSGCSALPGVIAILTDATSATPQVEIKEDGNSWHFMRRPTAIAWGEGELFASCGEARTDNYEDLEVPYAGPALWSSSPEIFGVEPKPGQNGTHLDMLHETPYCMGIAHESGNAYWAVNGDAGSLDRYDFHAPHQIGGEDHADGEVYRYAKGQLLRVAEVPSHAAYDSSTGFVYVADTGHGRVLRLDPKSATLGGPIETWEMLHGSGEMVGAEVVELVPPGTLERPSGLVLFQGVLFVTDNATSRIHAFNLEGKSLRVVDTELPPGSLAGVSLGPDSRLYFSNLVTGSVSRLEPRPR